MSNAKTSSKRRLKGNGHVFKKGNTYYLQFKINENRKTISLKTGSKRDADIEAKKYLGLISSTTTEEIALYVKQSKSLEIKRINLSDAWELFLRDPARPDSSKGTLKNYKSNFERLVKWLQQNKPKIKSLGQVDKQIAKEYASNLYSSGISAKTYNNHLKALMLIFRILLADSDILQNPFSKENIFRKVERKQDREKLSRFQIKQVLSTFDDPELHLMHKEENEILFYLGAYSGLRLYDAVYLQWNNIDFQDNLIRCIPKKTAKIQRPVVIPYSLN